MKPGMTVIVASTAILIAAALGCAPAVPPDTPETRLEQARALTAIEVEAGAYENMLDQGARLAREATADALTLEFERQLTAQEQDRVEAIMRSALAEVLTQARWQEAVAQVYAGEFTATEMAEAAAFYSSPTGTRILRTQGALDVRVEEAVEAIFDEGVDQFSELVDQRLVQEFPEFAGEGS